MLVQCRGGDLSPGIAQWARVGRILEDPDGEHHVVGRDRHTVLPAGIQHLGSPPGSERMHPPVNGVALIVASVPVTPPTKSIISLADPEAGSLLNRLADLPATRGSRQQLHWHENPQYRFAPRPDVMKDADWRRAVAVRRSRAAVRTADFCQPVAGRCGACARVPGYGLRSRTWRHAGRHVARGLAGLVRRHGRACRHAATSMPNSRGQAPSFTPAATM